MVENHMFTRVDTLELKDVMYRKVGHQRAEQYFDLLKRFLFCKLGKFEFDRSCVHVIGKENVYLHNQLIRSIVKNANHATVPPVGDKNVQGSVSVNAVNDQLRNGLQAICSEAFLPSPRKGRSCVVRDRTFKERPSPLGPLGKSPNFSWEEVVGRTQEQQSATEVLSPGGRPAIDVLSVEDGEEVEQTAVTRNIQSRSPVMAPHGISINVGDAGKSLEGRFRNKIRPSTCEQSGELPHTSVLRKCLEQKLEMEGMNISSDGVNLLNNALDCYVKSLMGLCINLAASRSGKELVPQVPNQCRHQGRWMLRQQMRLTQKPTKSISVSLLDFVVAMESKPHILGGDWALQLEKLHCRPFEI